MEPEIIEGFKLKLYSNSFIVALYCVSYISNELENEQVTLVPVKPAIETPLPYIFFPYLNTPYPLGVLSCSLVNTAVP